LVASSNRGKIAGMFIVELTYLADLSEIDAAMRAHMVFIKKHYAAGTFVMSGRKVPRDGGIILALGESREQIEELMRQDPFCSRGLASFRVTEFSVSQRADDIPKRVEG
jgi:uncharacterized protein YciI